MVLKISIKDSIHVLMWIVNKIFTTLRINDPQIETCLSNQNKCLLAFSHVAKPKWILTYKWKRPAPTSHGTWSVALTLLQSASRCHFRLYKKIRTRPDPIVLFLRRIFFLSLDTQRIYFALSPFFFFWFNFASNF